MSKQVEGNEKLSEETPQQDKKEEDEEQKPKESEKVGCIFEVKQAGLQTKRPNIHNAVVFLRSATSM